MKLLLFLLSIQIFLTNCKKSETITVSGSETMHSMILLVSNEFQKLNNHYKVDVRGGGSGEGIKELISGLTDIALSSRELDESEIEKLDKDNNLESIIVAYDGAALVVNEKNPLNQITLEEASGIFTGKIKNWKELGGNDEPILVGIRDTYSGTSHYIKEQVVRKLNLNKDEYFKNKKNEFSKDSKIMINNDEINDFISKNTNAISFMGMGIANLKTNLKLLKYAKTKKDEAYLPNIENVINGHYKLSRPLRAIYKATKSNKKSEELVNFLLSEEGQKSVLKSGYLRSTLPEVEVKANK
jgi:phosphate transport system substrate-binding protein